MQPRQVTLLTRAADIFWSVVPPRSQGMGHLGVAAGLCLGLSIMYMVYVYDFDNGVLSGGGIQRTLLKVCSMLLFFLSMRRLFSWSAINLNLPVKIPLLYVCATIAVIVPFLTGTYREALNIFFFLPVLALDWNRGGAAQLYKTIWKIVVCVVLVQLLLDPLFKAYFGTFWANAAVIGGMGNPNVFGLYLIVSGLACSILLGRGFRWLSVPLFLATILTGSLVSFVVGFGCLFVQLITLLRRAPLKGGIWAAVILLPLAVWGVGTDFINDSAPIQHAFGKFMDLQDFSGGQANSGPASLSVRRAYLAEGLDLMADSPVSILVGHPALTAMYNGDGLWTSFVVTYGLPVTLYFLVANILTGARGILSKAPDLLFSGCVIGVMLLFFVSNRVLDYWPAALIYLLPFSYLTNKGVRFTSRTHSLGHRIT